MQIEKQQIIWQELFFAIACFIQGATVVISSFVLTITMQDSWMIAFTGLISVSLLAWLYIRILWRYPGKNLIQINDLVLGPIVGKLFSVLYIFFFLTLASLNTRDMGTFVVNNIMPETPIAIVIIMFLFVCAWAVRSGIGNMMKYAFIFMMMAFMVISITTPPLLGSMSPQNFLPMFSLPLAKYIQATHIVTVIPLGEILAFTMIIPQVKDQSKVPKAIALGLGVGTLLMVMILCRDIATLGNLATLMSLSSFEAIRTINLWEVISRMEVLYATAMVTLQFFKVSILYYAGVVGLAQLCGLQHYRSVVGVYGVLIANYAQIVFHSATENAAWGTQTAPFFSSFFVIVLPALTMLVILMRKLPVQFQPQQGQQGQQGQQSQKGQKGQKSQQAQTAAEGGSKA